MNLKLKTTAHCLGIINSLRTQYETPQFPDSYMKDVHRDFLTKGQVG